MDSWETTDLLITVRAFPTPSTKHRETSCVAGVNLSKGVPIRVFPVRARETNIHKYEILSARVMKASSDSRPESHYIDEDSIVSVRKIDTKNNWSERTKLVEPLRVANSIEELLSLRERLGHSHAPSLSLIRPKEITKVEVTKKPTDDWTAQELAKLNRTSLFDRESTKLPLEFVPYDLRYSFVCDDSRCTGHRLRCEDWESSESIRKWMKDYGTGWQEKFLEKYRDEMLTKDLQFFVGTLKAHPATWTIIGLFYPPKTRDDQLRNLHLPLDD